MGKITKKKKQQRKTTKTSALALAPDEHAIVLMKNDAKS